MAKIADRYIKTHPYKIIEEGLHLAKTKVSESLFSLGNEYHGIRGFFDEGGSVDSLQGSYFNGIYEYALEETPNAYKGIVKRTHFMINSVNWVKCSIIINNQKLDLGKNQIKDFVRELDFQTGVLTRSFIWLVGNEEVRITFKRLLSMNVCTRAFQIIEITAAKEFNVNLSLELDSDVLHWSNHCYYDEYKQGSLDDAYFLEVKTPLTKQKVVSLMKIEGVDDGIVSTFPKRVKVDYSFTLKPNEKKTITRYVVNHIDKKQDYTFDDLLLKAKKDLDESFKEGYQRQFEQNSDYWKTFFDEHDIVIEGDEENQQGIRFCLFQLQQTYHGYDESNNIGAKGLTGEAYSGHTFWDSETYCLSYYLLNNIDAARNLLLYRYHTLPQAKKRAKMLDCEGACYPIATLNGDEACNLWQHASLQFQPSTGVAFAIFHYMNLTDDLEFVQNYGYEMLIEISKFMLNRGSYNANKTGFGYYCVMGPDEFQMMVNNNTYTNFMAKKTFEYTLEIRKKLSDAYLVEEKCQVDNAFFEKIKLASEKMIILYDDKTKLFEQHEGFFKLPHIDVNSIPVEDFPLYSHWSYDRIYRNDIIKQPDVLMFMFLYNQSFTREQKLNNYDYYEPRTIHESSLSPSVHSILACELGKNKQALDFFGFATRLDLDDYNRNTNEGLHTTSISAAWSNIVYGFGGIRTDGKTLLINPHIPSSWKSYSFKITYHQSLINIYVNQNEAKITLLKGNKVTVKVRDQIIVLNDEYIIGMNK